MATNSTKPTILVVEDDARLLDIICRGLGEEGFECVRATNQSEAMAALHLHPYYCILLDWGLPDGSGIDILRHLRQEVEYVPVIFLTARDTVSSAVIALDGGADDYIRKPFRLEELFARVRAVKRRSRVGADTTQTRWGGWVLSPNSRHVSGHGADETLTEKEFALFSCLVAAKGEVVPRSEIYLRVWGTSSPPGTNPLEVCVSYLRAKLDVAGEPSLIRTHRGVGYSVVG